MEEVANFLFLSVKCTVEGEEGAFLPPKVEAITLTQAIASDFSFDPGRWAHRTDRAVAIDTKRKLASMSCRLREASSPYRDMTAMKDKRPSQYTLLLNIASTRHLAL